MRFLPWLLLLTLIEPGCCSSKCGMAVSPASMPSSAPPRLNLKAGQPYTPATDEVWVNLQDHLEILADRNRLRALLQ
jgi:hypothetical protein